MNIGNIDSSMETTLHSTVVARREEKKKAVIELRYVRKEILRDNG